jgi:predicted DNA-binding transcriptional regulator AlpA
MSNVTPLGVKTATALKVNPPIHQLPEAGFLRLPQIVGDKKKGIPAIIPIGKSTFLKRVHDGVFPAPVKLGERTVAWKVEDIKALIAGFGGSV